MATSLKSIGWVDKVGWTDEAREAAAAARAARAAEHGGEASVSAPKEVSGSHEDIKARGWKMTSSGRGQADVYEHPDRPGEKMYVKPEPGTRGGRPPQVNWSHTSGDKTMGSGSTRESIGSHLDRIHAENPKKAEWTEKFIGGLPDSSFAYVEPGGTKDSGGMTEPRGLRHFAFRDAGGTVDAEQLALAIEGVEKSSLPKATKAKVLARLETTAVEKYITRDGDKWVVHAESGKVLGTHDSKADAVRQLAAIEANKPHEKCLEKGSACDVKWPVCPADPAHRQSPRFKAEAPGSRVQALVFDKDKYPEVEDAKNWANDHGFESGKVDESEEGIRLRQEDPGAFARMRTISLTEGVKAVVGFPKKAVKAVQDAFFLTASGRLAFKASDLAAATFEPVFETETGTIYKVACGGAKMYFAERDGHAAHLPAFHMRKSDTLLPIIKAKDEMRYTLGVVYPAKEVDFHGDFMSDVELEKAAWGVMQKGEPPKVGLMHRPGTAGAGTVVESYIYRGPKWTTKAAGGEEQTVDPGDWLMGVVWNDVAWEAVKSGQLKGYSLQGVARKEAF